MGRRRDKLLGSRRRQVLQLEDSDNRESFLAQHGYYPRYGEEEEEEMDVNAMFHHDGYAEEDMDCDNDERSAGQEEDNESSVPVKSVQENGSHGAGGDNEHGTIDSELANFMAEIEAISSVAPPPPPPDEVEVKKELPSETDSPQQEPPEVEPETRAELPVEEEEDVHLEEPVTSWQQCLDENTECYYYWNTESNEVTWDIPAEFSQYLLLVKELEEKVSKLQKQGKKVFISDSSGKIKESRSASKHGDSTDQDPAVNDMVYGPFLPTSDAAENSVTSDKPPSKRETKDDSSHGAASEAKLQTGGDNSVSERTKSRSSGASVGLIQATGKLLSADYYDSDDEHSEEDEPKAKPEAIEEEEEDIEFDIDDIDRELELALERKQAEMKKAEQTSESKVTEKNSTDGVSEKTEQRGSQDGEKPLPEDRSPGNSEIPDQKNVLECKPVELQVEVDVLQTSSSVSELDQTSDKTFSEKQKKQDEEDLEKDKRPGILKHTKREEKSRTDVKESKSSKEVSESVTKGRKEDRKLDRAEEKRSSEDLMDRKSSDRKEDRKSSREERRSREERKSERKEEKRSSEYKDKKKGHDRKEDKKGHRHKHDKEESSKKDKSRKNAEKRSLSEEEFEDKSHRKRSKHKHKDKDKEKEKEKYISVESVAVQPISMVTDVLEVDRRTKTVDPKLLSTDKTVDKKIEKVQNVQSEIEELSSIVLEKLEFLEVDKSDLTGLQILLISLETRIQDWKFGGLTSKYLHQKLEEASTQLLRYEESAAPAGWLTHWDRTYRRYFYTNNRTGDSQWDYPDPDPHAEEVVTDEHAGSASTATGNKDDADLTRQDSTEKLEGVCDDPDTKDQKEEKEKSPIATVEDDEDLPKKKKRESKHKDKHSKAVESDSVMSVHPGEPPPPGMEEEVGVPLPTEPLLLETEKYELSPAHSVDMDNVDDKNMCDDSKTDMKSNDDDDKDAAVISRPPQLVSGDAVVKPAAVTPLFPAFNPDNIPVPTKPEEGHTAPEAAQSTDGEKNVPDSGQSSQREKKKKKDKAISSSSLSLKKKKLSSLVQKWQQVQQEVEREEEKSKERESYLHRYSP